MYATYLFVDTVAYPGFGSTDRYINLLPVFSSLGVRAIVCVAKSMIEAFSLQFLPSRSSFFCPSPQQC